MLFMSCPLYCSDTEEQARQVFLKRIGYNSVSHLLYICTPADKRDMISPLVLLCNRGVQIALHELRPYRNPISENDDMLEYLLSLAQADQRRRQVQQAQPPVVQAQPDLQAQEQIPQLQPGQQAPQQQEREENEPVQAIRAVARHRQREREQQLLNQLCLLGCPVPKKYTWFVAPVLIVSYGFWVRKFVQPIVSKGKEMLAQAKKPPLSAEQYFFLVSCLEEIFVNFLLANRSNQLINIVASISKTVLRMSVLKIIDEKSTLFKRPPPDGPVLHFLLNNLLHTVLYVIDDSIHGTSRFWVPIGLWRSYKK